jgi:hypothetical protein
MNERSVATSKRCPFRQQNPAVTTNAASSFVAIRLLSRLARGFDPVEGAGYQPAQARNSL